jgi:hypothetical protein
MNFVFNFISVLLIILLVACSPVKQTIQVSRPSDISIPSDIKTVAIVNRTVIDKKNKVINVLEGLTSGEHLGQDRMAEQEVLSGLNNILQTSPTVKVKLTGIELTGSGKGNIFPNPLDSTEVIRICDQYNADAIAVLEMFDSDCSGRIVIIKAGFRVYDRRNNSIADQYYYTYRTKWKRSHTMTGQRSTLNRFSENNAINQAAYETGVNYGRRIATTMMEVVQKR